MRAAPAQASPARTVGRLGRAAAITPARRLAALELAALDGREPVGRRALQLAVLARVRVAAVQLGAARDTPIASAAHLSARDHGDRRDHRAEHEGVSSAHRWMVSRRSDVVLARSPDRSRASPHRAQDALGSQVSPPLQKRPSSQSDCKRARHVAEGSRCMRRAGRRSRAPRPVTEARCLRSRSGS